MSNKINNYDGNFHNTCVANFIRNGFNREPIKTDDEMNKENITDLYTISNDTSSGDGGVTNPLFNLSKEQLEEMLKRDKENREKEEILIKYETSEREAMAASSLNRLIEAEEEEANRMKMFCECADYVNKSYAEAAAKRTLTTRAIQDIMFKALFGDPEK